jgi:monoamine oxidase
MHTKRIIVAGAGLAGLTAARELEGAGASVTIVEARDRTGGRVWTFRDGFANGQYGELGGEFIDAEHEALHRLCDEFGLRRVRVLRGGFTHRFRDRNGRPHVSRTKPWRELELSLAPLCRQLLAARREASAEAEREIAAISLRDSMLAFLGGGSASARLRNRVAQGAEYLLSALCWLGMAGVDVHAVRAATWEDDPWARGGYAYLDPGFDPVLRPYLARRAGRLVFAGEHTSARWQGYMNGAVESGIRAARELVES